MTRRWIYFLNPFYTATKENYLLFYLISIFHYNALKALRSIPWIDDMFKFYEPFHNAYIDAYNLWEVSSGTRKGSVKSMSELLDRLMSTLAEKWDIAVQAAGIVRDSGPYLQLLPHHRQDFMRGRQDQRIAEVRRFSRALRNVPALSTLQTEVADFLQLLETTDQTKDGDKTVTKQSSSNVARAQEAAAEAMYKNLGTCINHYGDDNEEAEQFFDLSVIRDHMQVVFTGTVEKFTSENILHRTLHANEVIYVNVEDVEFVEVFAAATADQQSSSKMIRVDAGPARKITVEELGNSLEFPYINIRNSDNAGAKFEVRVA